MKQDDFLTVAQAAAIRNRPAVTVRYWCKHGGLPAQKCGRAWMIRLVDLMKFKPRKAGRPLPIEL